MTGKRAFALSLALVVLAGACAKVAAAAPGAGEPEPLLAYYYIWYDHSSWRRAKTDYPLLGRYSSDNVRVLRKHVREAKKAGIEGFIVSWKSTKTLDRRLAKLVSVARSEQFKLAIIYQGLDFQRNPLPASRVRRDLRRFKHRYGQDPVFNVFGRPLVIWSGTWKFSPSQVSSVTSAVRPALLVLASEKNVAGYNRLEGSVDGDAYYWSSVNPYTDSGYQPKLNSMGEAVHADNGLWLAPAAPGFDARRVGGTRIVAREDGETLRRELAAAVQSTPDGVGLISWNEFSENSQIEPSIRYGRRYVTLLRELWGTHFSAKTDVDSSDNAGGIGYGLPILTGLVGVLFAAILVAFTRRHIKRGETGSPTTREA